MESPRGKGILNKVRWWYWLAYGSVVFWMIGLESHMAEVLKYVKEMTE